MNFSNIIGATQLRAIFEFSRGEEGPFFVDKLRELKLIFENMPKIYETENRRDPIVHLHYFLHGCHWWITERDTSEEQLQAFGAASLHGDTPELGYISIEEITRLGAEIDLYWAGAHLSGFCPWLLERENVDD